MTALTLEAASRSETGRRSNNEDAVFSSPQIVAVADGVGGHAAGEVASQWAIEALNQLAKRRLDAPLDVEIAEAVAWGNQTIGFIAECRPEFAGMSSTLTAIGLERDTFVIVNIGDSRTYLLRDGALTQLTHDDSFVQELVDRGHITAEQSRHHPSRSLVLKALDGDPERRPAIATLDARAGDRLLLCSDGLSDVVDDDAIRDVLVAERSREACADRLVALALDHGARDNVSVVIADVTQPA
jgi:PPM family protein phosphatase